MIVADFTGKGNTQDLVLALPPDTELGGVTLQLLTANDGEFRSTQTLNLGEGVYSSCAALHAGTGSDDGMYLVMDAWTGTSSLVSDIILYDGATGFLQPYRPSGMSDIQRSTLRYHRELLSRDLDDNGTVDIPVEIDDGGTLQTPMDKRLSFLLWKDYTSMAGGNSKFGVYDSEYNIFMELPESMHGNILIRSNQSGTGWLICNAEGTTVYCEMRVVDPADNAATGVGNYLRIANIGSQQLQARVVTSYYGLSLDFISQNTVLPDQIDTEREIGFMKRVLVVEDEASIREMVALNLKMAGWEVVEAPSAERALELMHSGERCDAALLDIMLPGMRRLESARDDPPR